MGIADIVLAMVVFGAVACAFAVMYVMVAQAECVGRWWRLVECVARSYWVLVPWSALTVGFTAAYDVPSEMFLYSDIGGLTGLLGVASRMSSAQWPYMSTLDIINGYFALWAIGLQCCAR